MNKFKYIVYIALVAIVATSCRKTLELAPEDYYGDGNFWQNESQVTNFMVGLHKQFRDNRFMFLRLGEMRGGGFSNTDRQNTSLSELTIINHDIEETSSGIGSWAGFYGPILQLNLFIQKVEAADFLVADKKNYLLGQAYAMRAYYYFHLLRTYGGVPIQLEPEVSNGNTDAVALRKARASEAEVLDAIKADVNKSISLFGTAGAPADKSQWNPLASLMLKGEVYLWSAKLYNTTADLAEAKSALNAVTGTSLLPSFGDVFKTKNNSEVIFAVRYRDGEAEMGTAYSYFLYSTYNFDNLHVKDSTTLGPTLVDPLNIASAPAQIIQRYAYTYELFQSYDVADTRRDATFYDYYKTSASGADVVVTVRNTALVKFPGQMDAANRRVFTDDWPVYREADRLLMLAEITNAEGGDPSSYIQQIRDRAFANADPTPFVSGSQDDNELAIFAERSKEFVYEGKRWYDIRRMKYGGEPLVFISASHPYGVLDKGTQGYKILWPVETAIWTNDPLVDQTPGYATSKPK
ncbi:RagB/SusD family nutrient uptake outer membrane protein [Agriterribacter sp.]|uniref:RagB/SusD family nutrient uptake outer membrane protein n=1 Tax=Agriterribacter sp. TaxID=2821509 RepID=UPI002CCA29D9|nr:RagB/SusD family nutrient uptake outer membrane protein [Agriterribacter sp.]HRP58236.1 RagB/SusD family nutrient uptake outer membrane protein [Agriterribacter sp.]